MFSFYIFFAITLAVISHTHSKNMSSNPPVLYTNSSTNPSWTNWTFKEYLLKFKPSRVWEHICNNKTRKEINNKEFESIYKGIDETDEFLSLKVPNGNPKLILRRDGRRWAPPGDITNVESDKFSLKQRFIELMKQAIYQARNRMVIMQLYRSTYRRSSVYKMGFLMSKTDQAVKTFARYTFKAFMGCFYTRLRWSRYPLIELLESYERVLDLWFDIELLIDLILINDQNCKRMLNQVMTNKKEAWNFVD